MMNQNQRFKRGDIVLVLFPNSDLRTAKLRPAIIVQADNLETGLPQSIVSMITSRLSRSSHPSRILIKLSTTEGQQSGLLSDSVIMTDNLATIHYNEIDRVVGTFPTINLEAPLRHTLGL